MKERLKAGIDELTDEQLEAVCGGYDAGAMQSQHYSRQSSGLKRTGTEVVPVVGKFIATHNGQGIIIQEE